MTLTVRQEKMLKRRGFTDFGGGLEDADLLENKTTDPFRIFTFSEALTECRRMNACEKQARYRRKKALQAVLELEKEP